MGYIGPLVKDQLLNNRSDYILEGFDLGLFGHCLFGASSLPEIALKKQYFGDVRKFPSEVLQGIDSVIYLAAISNDPMGKEFEILTHEINHQACFAIARQRKEMGVRNFVLASSCSVYGAGGTEAKKESDPIAPLSAYAVSKVEAEKSLQTLADSNFIITCLRFATACGDSPRLRLDLILNDFVATAILKNEISILSDGTPLRPLIHVKDMARALEWGVNREAKEGNHFLIINAGSNRWNFSVLELANLVSEVLGSVKISINKEAPPDKRSYKVNFDLFESLAGNLACKEDIRDTIIQLAESIKRSGFNQKDFYQSDLIRLNVLRKMKAKNII